MEPQMIFFLLFRDVVVEMAMAMAMEEERNA